MLAAIIGEVSMRTRLHFAITALAATALVAGLPSNAPAASGVVNLTVAKGGVIIGGSSGTGTLRFKRRTYPLVVGGVSGGFTFGGSEARLAGRIANIRRPTDIEGSYSSTTGGATIGNQGEQSITLSNEKGVVLQLKGTLTGLMVNADVGGMTIQLRK
jgi:hypothetical protein